jgi:hypothetical protein
LTKFSDGCRTNLTFDVFLDEALKFAVEPKLFGKWTYEGVQCSDQSLIDYLSVKSVKAQVYVPYTAGKYQKKRF